MLMQGLKLGTSINIKYTTKWNGMAFFYLGKPSQKSTSVGIVTTRSGVR